MDARCTHKGSPVMSMEKRAHARVAALINARVLSAGSENEIPARDISRAGIFLHTKEPLGPIGGRVSLKLALMAGIRPITVNAEIARIASGAMSGYGLRFVFENEPAQRAQVIDLIDRAMLGPGIDKRAWPRVYQLVPVICRTRVEIKGVLRDLCEGGAGLYIQAPVNVNDEVTIEIARSLHNPAMALEGYVCAAEPSPVERDVYRVGVRFTRLSPTIRAQLLEFLKQQYRR